MVMMVIMMAMMMVMIMLKGDDGNDDGDYNDYSMMMTVVVMKESVGKKKVGISLKCEKVKHRTLPLVVIANIPLLRHKTNELQFNQSTICRNISPHQF